MPLINHPKKEINAKLVFFGPTSAGKATTLNFIYGKLKEASRGQFKAMELQKDRMLFFDFLPSTQASVNGYTVRFHLYTISGHVTNQTSWRMVLKGVDGIVLVADSSPAGSAANTESTKQLEGHLAVYGKSLKDIPLVLLCNKQDIPQATAPEEVARAVGMENATIFPAIATKGEGVLDGIFSLVKGVMKNIRASGIDLGEQSANAPFSERIQEQGDIRATAAVAPEAGGHEQQAATGSAPAQALREVPAHSEDEPVIAMETPELLEGGTIRVPLSIRYGTRVTRMTLALSLSPSD